MPVSERSHRTALLLSTLLTLAGSCGACNGVQRYAAGPAPAASMIEVGDAPGAHETAEFYAAAGETYLAAPDRKPLGLANLVVSMMLVVGSFMLGGRRASTVWFLTNALAANLIFIVAEAAVLIARVQARSGLLARKLGAVAVAQAPPNHPIALDDAIVQAKGAILLGCVGLGVVAFLKLVFHVVLLVRARSPEVAEFLAAGPDVEE